MVHWGAWSTSARLLVVICLVRIVKHSSTIALTLTWSVSFVFICNIAFNTNSWDGQVRLGRIDTEMIKQTCSSWVEVGGCADNESKQEWRKKRDSIWSKQSRMDRFMSDVLEAQAVGTQCITCIDYRVSEWVSSLVLVYFRSSCFVNLHIYMWWSSYDFVHVKKIVSRAITLYTRKISKRIAIVIVTAVHQFKAW